MTFFFQNGIYCSIAQIKLIICVSGKKLVCNFLFLITSIKWEEQFARIKKVKQPDSALCTICNKIFGADGGGLTQGRNNQKSKSDKKKESSDRHTLITEHFSLVTTKMLIFPLENIL